MNILKEAPKVPNSCNSVDVYGFSQSLNFMQCNELSIWYSHFGHCSQSFIESLVTYRLIPKSNLSHVVMSGVERGFRPGLDPGQIQT